jgi:acetoacetyl-CoA reductase
MSKSVSELALQNMFMDFTGYMEDARNQMFKIHNPLEYTFDTLFRLSEFTGNAIDQFVRHHTDTLDFYLPTQTEQKTDQPFNQLAAVKPGRIETGYIAVVTGGIGGIGSEICKRLYTDGHQVIATYISFEKDLARTWQADRRKEGFEIDIVECDVTDFESCKKMGKRLESAYNRIDILVNCAGITRDATLRKMEPDKWHAVLDTNLDSVFNVTRNFIDGMITRGYGRIINISSVNGQKGQFGQTNYSTAKAGIIGFSKALALELADCGITVNSVCPGYVGTSMVEAIPEDIKNSIIAKIPVKRLAKPAEVAAAVAFLAEENSGYITGSEISVNGGLFTGVS